MLLSSIKAFIIRALKRVRTGRSCCCGSVPSCVRSLCSRGAALCQGEIPLVFICCHSRCTGAAVTPGLLMPAPAPGCAGCPGAELAAPRCRQRSCPAAAPPACQSTAPQGPRVPPTSLPIPCPVRALGPQQDTDSSDLAQKLSSFPSKHLSFVRLKSQ